LIFPAPNGPVTFISLVDPSINTGMAAGDTYDGIENIIGSPYNDVITGNDEDNIIIDMDAIGGGFVTYAYNQFYGNGGNDRFIGSGNHIDWFDGGTGEDTVDYSRPNALGTFVFVDLQDVMQNDGHARSDRFTSIEDIIGTSGDDTILGDWRNNEFHGGGDDDRLMGRNGTDTLWGDEGIDTAVFRGDVGDYTFRVLHFNGDRFNERFLEVTDLNDNRDGVDYVIGIEQLEFNGVMHNISEWII
jgi:Ca2+-binding RTX toxin-like protein